jgi:hypothetical protein
MTLFMKYIDYIALYKPQCNIDRLIFDMGDFHRSCLDILAKVLCQKGTCFLGERERALLNTAVYVLTIVNLLNLLLREAGFIDRNLQVTNSKQIIHAYR